MTTILKFSEGDVKDAIMLYAKSKGFNVTGKIDINLGTAGGNYGGSEHSVLKDITAECTKIEKTYDGGGPGGRD